VRFLLLSRKGRRGFRVRHRLPESAIRRNPVYTCEYAHARIARCLVTMEDAVGGEDRAFPGHERTERRES